MNVTVLNTNASNIAIAQVWDKGVLIATLEVREGFGRTIKTTSHMDGECSQTASHVDGEHSHTFIYK